MEGGESLEPGKAAPCASLPAAERTPWSEKARTACGGGQRRGRCARACWQAVPRATSRSAARALRVLRGEGDGNAHHEAPSAERLRGPFCRLCVPSASSCSTRRLTSWSSGICAVCEAAREVAKGEQEQRAEKG